jgi:hypothetical protein
LTVLAALLAALLGAPSPAGAKIASPIVGMGEQSADMFTSELWTPLGLRHAHYLAPWDVLEDPVQLARLDAWLAAARTAGVTPLLGLSHSVRTPRRARVLPTPREYMRQFRRLRARYPYIQDWEVWNEANHRTALTNTHPERAARFFDIVARDCRGCHIVAADVLDLRGMAAWIRAFRRAAHHRPRIWGLHSWGDANHDTTRGTRTLLALTGGPIWVTETGGIVARLRHKGGRPARRVTYTVEHAARAIRHALELASLSPRIQRIYLYNWQAPNPFTSWDSGLLDPSGSPRPAYDVLKAWLQTHLPPSGTAHPPTTAGQRSR